jgi:hypothetical protein
MRCSTGSPMIPIRLAPRDPPRRLVHAERVWAFDPGNMSCVLDVVSAVEAASAGG